MIIFIRQPFIVQNYPIARWDGIVPERASQLHVRVDLDLLHDGGDSEKINALMKAVQELMEGATFRDTGNKVVPAKLAQLVTQDGRESVVPAKSLPRGMFIWKEIEDGQGKQEKRVRQEGGEGVQEELQPDVQITTLGPQIVSDIFRGKNYVIEDDLRDEGREAGAEEEKPDRDPSGA